ncbi:hypothetical protein ElyMa_006143200 [Elysia marginata]|uniref:Uncharacterized protein n=1 Tax=Elysia marginata TaxID=1093978 RepID=A0AAV4H0R7_9GAST|nr:hypothetical protein ElyMa_006143200 [Elysia marginata]
MSVLRIAVRNRPKSSGTARNRLESSGCRSESSTVMGSYKLLYGTFKRPIQPRSRPRAPQTFPQPAEDNTLTDYNNHSTPLTSTLDECKDSIQKLPYF